MMGAATDVVVKPMSLFKKPQTNLAISSTAPDALFFRPTIHLRFKPLRPELGL